MSIMDNQTGSQIMARHGADSGSGSQSVAHRFPVRIKVTKADTLEDRLMTFV